MTDLTHRVQFFLGANSAEGFSSLYDQWVDQRSIQAFYVIKGGAGCGKSTLMGQVARHMEAEGYDVEYIRCSGDPDSLDGILIPKKGAALADGTAPHGMDPAFTGATGHYIDLGEGYDRKALFLLREEIIQGALAYQACYPQAYRCIRGAEESWRRGRQPLHTETTLAKTEKRAAGILSRERKGRRTGMGRVSRRFLGGVTCQGRLLLEDTVEVLCERGYELRDECGLADPLLRRLEAGFLEGGYDVIACADPVNPNRLAHLLIPERSLAFVSSPVRAGERYKTIRTESLVEKAVWQEGRSFLRLSNRVAEELLAEGIEHLARAKAFHDDLEALYHPHVDFTRAKEMAARTAEEILSLPDIAS